MTLKVLGSPTEKSTIEGWLREICWSVTIDPATGVVSLVSGLPPPDGKTTGCGCLSQLIASDHTTTVVPVHGPNTKIRLPNSDKSKKIGKATGGFTVTADLPATLLRANGQPGPGTDVTTYIDITNNDGKGYKSKKKRNRGVPFPMWIILAHELTTGHATRMTSGEVPSINGERPDEQAEEELAKRSEDPHRDAHGDSSRHR